MIMMKKHAARSWREMHDRHRELKATDQRIEELQQEITMGREKLKRHAAAIHSERLEGMATGLWPRSKSSFLFCGQQVLAL